MPRKGNAPAREPASLPEVLISPSHAAPNERDAYWLQLAADWQQFSDAIKTEDWDALIAALPEGLWGETLRLYLYRKPDDMGVMVKNPPGEWKYLQVFYKPVEPQFIQDKWGGGKYEWRLNWVRDKENRTIKRNTFDIWGDPRVKPGQTVEIDGKQVPITGAPGVATPAQEESGSAISKVIDASSRASESGMEILSHASKAAIAMVRDQAATASAPAANPLQDKLLTVLLEKAFATPPTPPENKLQDKLMTVLVERAFGDKETPEREETTLDQVNTIVQTVTGRTLADLGRGNSRVNPVAAEYGWVAPLADFGVKALASLPGIIAQMRQAKDEDFRRALYIRNLDQAGRPATPPPPPDVTALVAQPQPAPSARGPQAVPDQPQPGSPDRGQVVHAIVQRVCQGFDRHRDTGGDIAAAITVELGEHIEASGLDGALTDGPKMTAVLMEFPQLAAELATRTAHAKWKLFEEDFFSYMQDRYGAQEGGPVPAA